ncbi:glucan biosynthesis protein [Methyloligella sp. GL2]|nr:glucan biosynthesis protein [Methyloligella sp. GL2]
MTALFASAGLPWPKAEAASADGGLQLGEEAPYSFDALKKRAKALAEKPYVAPKIPHEDVLETLGFEAYQGITFDPEKTMWREKDSPFAFQLFHQGKFFKTPVKLYTVEDGAARQIRYSPDVFSYKDGSLRNKLPDDLGYAGFRMMEPDNKSDWLSFLGASYFRAAGPERQYGLSARGLAVDTGLPRPEEFPRFSEFWLHKPKDGAGAVEVDALLESESVTGAYRFLISQPDEVVMDIEADLYVRKPIERLGIAPLTSMFWFSETNRKDGVDWRPEVHDSDGLAMWTGKGERIWRPLNNPATVRTSAFLDENPRGFGLLQRDRLFADYEDDSTFYDKRPSVWVEPIGDWGAGEVHLLEIPTDDEIYDNIGAYWKPAQPIKGGDELKFSYRLHWVAGDPFGAPTIGRVVSTRTGQGGVPGQPRPANTTKFVIDFEGGPLDRLEQRFDLDAVIDASRGEIENPYVIKVVGTDRWRAFFDLNVEGTEPVEIRCYVALDGETLTETWLYQFVPGANPA